MNLYLIRHTKVAVETGICYGQSDVEISESFLEEAELIKKQINGISFNQIYSSPLLRCKKLAEFLFDTEIKYDNRLKELNFGNWELQHWDDLRNPKVTEWMNDFVNTPCPNGESFIELHRRVSTFLSEIRCANQDNIAIITHGGVIRSIIAHIQHENLKDAFKREIQYGELVKLKI